MHRILSSLLGGVLAGSAVMALALPSTAGAATAAPTVTSLTPTSGTTAGGTLVVVYGTNFTAAATVRFGSGAGTGVTDISATTLVAYAPAATAGVVNVTVTTAAGTSAVSAADQFTYVVTPTFADESGHGNTGTSGAGVLAGVTGPLSGTESASFSGAVETEVNTTTASASPQDFSLAGWFKTTSTSGGSIIGFTNTRNGVGSTADDRMVWMDNAGHLDFAVAPGDRAEQIISTQTTSAAYNNGAWHFVVASVGPGGLELFVDGHLVAQNTAVTTAEAYSGWWYLGFAGEDLGGWTDTPADGYWNGDLADLAVIPSQLTAAQVSTLNGAATGPAFLADTSALAPSSYWPMYTTVTALSPALGPTSGGTPVIIAGTGFVAGATVHFGANAATNVVVEAPTTLSATSPAGAAGAVNVTVTTSGGTSPVVPVDQFTYGTTPTVSAVSPSAGPTAAGTAVTITGAGFVTGAAVNFGANAATNVVVVGPSTITAAAPAGAGGGVNVTVTTSGGTSPAVSADQFTYDALPSVTAVSPAVGPASGGTAVTITGAGFVTGATVNFGAIAATKVVVDNATTITATAPAGAAGAINVTVGTPGGTSAISAADQFTYAAAPTVTALSPTSGLTTGGTSVTITGTGFVSGATVLFGNSAGTAAVVVNATTITVTTPARAAGPVYVTVTTPGGTSATGAAGQFSYVTYPLAPTSVTATQGATAQDLSVAWAPSTGGTPATGAIVQLYRLVNGTYVYQQAIACGASCTSTVFRELSVGATYAALVWPTIAVGPGAPAASGAVTLATTCGAGACVTLNADQAIGPADHADAGILSSVFDIGTLVADLVGLNTTMFRSAPPPVALGLYDWSSWDEAVAAGAQTTMVLSDEYSAAYGGAPPTPWSNWASYNTEITALVTSLAASGEPINYWEVYNEPGGDDGYYSAAGYASETPALLLQQFLDTYQDIKAVVPDAAVIGPSLEHWSDYPGQYGTADHAFDMATFLNFAAANNLQLAAISWHEIDDNLGTAPEENSLAPANIEDHVSEARRLIAALPQLGDPKIFINEYGMPEVQTIPGWDVAYLSALTDAGVDSADRACWNSDCANPTLDGLLTLAGLSTPSYYERLVYAETSGNMIATTSTADSVTALGSYDSGTGELTALIGRGVGCTQDPTCATNWPTATDAAPTSVTVTVTVPWSSGTAALALTDFEGSTDAAVSAPTPVDSTAPVVPNGSGGGTVTFSIPSFADGDAYGLNLTRSP